MSDIVIVGAARTPVGSFLGSLGTVPAHRFGGDCHCCRIVASDRGG